MTRRRHEKQVEGLISQIGALQDAVAEHEALIKEQACGLEELDQRLRTWKGRAVEQGEVHSAAVKATKDLLELLQSKGKE